MLRSADQSQDEVVELSMEEIKKIEKVYTSGSAICLWNELAKSSALFQLYMDDIWLDEDEDYFLENGNNIEHCCKYLESLYRQEERIFNMANNIDEDHVKKYINCFDTAPVCKQLAEGLKESLDAIIRAEYFSPKGQKARAVLPKLEKLLQRIQEAETYRYSIINK